jgi:hypothetical protein
MLLSDIFQLHNDTGHCWMTNHQGFTRNRSYRIESNIQTLIWGDWGSPRRASSRIPGSLNRHFNSGYIGCEIVLYIESDILIALVMKSYIFWDTALCNLFKISRHFRRKHSSLGSNMEATYSSETSVDFQRNSFISQKLEIFGCYKNWISAYCVKHYICWLYQKSVLIWNRWIFKTKKNSVALVSKRTIPTERPPLVCGVNANFCW